MLDNKKFIESSIKEIVKESANISLLNCKGIEAFPMQDYLMQSTFLKMTGYSEQKLKCICWDIASIDYEFRYQVYQHWKFGECSSIEEKNDIFNSIIKKIQDFEPEFKDDKIKVFLDEDDIPYESHNFVKNIINNSCLKYFMEQEFYLFSTDKNFFKKGTTVYVSSSKILNKDISNRNGLSFIYHQLFRQRNRCAHNLSSYQKNLPKITELLDKDIKDNYFYYFTELIILDEIYVKLYKKLISLLEKNSW